MNEPPSRWLSRDALAHYICVRVAALPRLNRQGKLPPPSYHLGSGSPRWDREAIDAAFEDRPPTPSIGPTTAEIVRRIHAEADAKAARRAKRAGR